MRDIPLREITTTEEIREILYNSGTVTAHRNDRIYGTLTLGSLPDLLDDAGFWEMLDEEISRDTTTIGEIIDRIAANPDAQVFRERKIDLSARVGDVIDILGEDNVKTFLEEKAAEASLVEAYDRDRVNILGYWSHLGLFILVFAALATVTLEFIDRDKR